MAGGELVLRKTGASSVDKRLHMIVGVQMRAFAFYLRRFP